jgi:hypothetical protein
MHHRWRGAQVGDAITISHDMREHFSSVLPSCALPVTSYTSES